MFIHLLKLLRINNIAFIALFQVIIRYCLILPVLRIHDLEPMLSDLHFAMLVIATMLIAAGGNVINDYFDVITDKINRPDRMVVDKHLDRRMAILIHVVLTLIGVFIGLYFAFIFHNENQALLFIGVPILLWFYSTTFKKQMLVGNLIIAMLTALTALLVVSVEFAALAHYKGAHITESTACKQAWFVTSAFAFYAFITNLTREIVKDMEDVEGDKAIGCRTLPIEMGTRYSKIVVTMLQIFMLTTIFLGFLAAEPRFFSFAEGLPPVIVITIPIIVSIVLLAKASTSRHYHNISTLYKFIMLLGALSLVYLYFIKQ